MKGKKLYHCSYFFLLGAFFLFPVAAQTPTPTPEAIAEIVPVSPAKSETDLIHAGDLIDVDVVGSLEYDWRGTLNPEGFLDVVNFGENPIYGLCKSEEEIAAEIAKAYSKTLRDPKVAVRILDRSNRPLAVIYGAIKTPQRFQIKRPIRLNELLIVSGGLTDKASGEIQIYRPPNLNCRQVISDSKTAAESGEKRERFVAASSDDGANFINIRLSEMLTGKNEANPQILSGDVITVRESELIYVIGGVANPKPISARAQITLSRAVASAGGITKDGDAKKITIYRREAGETKIIEADLEKIRTKKSEDIILKAFDIIEVPQRGSGAKKLPPIIDADEPNGKTFVNLPLRVID